MKRKGKAYELKVNEKWAVVNIYIEIGSEGGRKKEIGTARRDRTTFSLTLSSIGCSLSFHIKSFQ